MKVASVPFVLAALGLAAQVSASPLRVYVLAPTHGESNSADIDSSKAASPLRWGLAAAAPGQPPMMMMHKYHHQSHEDNKEEQSMGETTNEKDFENISEALQVESSERESWKPLDSGSLDAENSENDTKDAGESHWIPLPAPSHPGSDHEHQLGRMRMGGCAGRRGGMRSKAIHLANWLRQKVGMEPIMPHHHFHQHHPFFKDERIRMGHRPEGIHGMHHEMHHADGVIRITHHLESPDHLPPPHHMMMHHQSHPHHPHFRPHSFVGRLMKSLMVLGPWEGRLVAFVFGCGIGALLRMFFVFTVLAHRAITRRNREREMGEVEVIFEAVPPSPPTYSFPDEKVQKVEDSKTIA